MWFGFKKKKKRQVLSFLVLYFLTFTYWNEPLKQKMLKRWYREAGRNPHVLRFVPLKIFHLFSLRSPVFAELLTGLQGCTAIFLTLQFMSLKLVTVFSRRIASGMCCMLVAPPIKTCLLLFCKSSQRWGGACSLFPAAPSITCAWFAEVLPVLFNGTCSTWSPLLKSQSCATNWAAFWVVEKTALCFEETGMEGLMLLYKDCIGTKQLSWLQWRLSCIGKVDRAGNNC